MPTTENDTPLSVADLQPFLRALLKDTAGDLSRMMKDPQVGQVMGSFSDAQLEDFLELARGEYTRQRPKRAHTVTVTVASQQYYASPSGALSVDEVCWAPAGYDLDEIAALAAALAGSAGLLWGGGVPIVGQVYFDSPASLQVWSIIRETWRKTFGGHWIPDVGGYNLQPVPVQSGLNILVFYTVEQLWSDIPWSHRNLIMSQAVLSAVQALALQMSLDSSVGGSKLAAMVELVKLRYQDGVNLRQPGVTAGRS